MQTTIANLKKGDVALIKNFDVEAIPLKLLEMGCLPGEKITVEHAVKAKRSIRNLQERRIVDTPHLPVSNYFLHM